MKNKKILLLSIITTVAIILVVTVSVLIIQNMSKSDTATPVTPEPTVPTKTPVSINNIDTNGHIRELQYSVVSLEDTGEDISVNFTLTLNNPDNYEIESFKLEAPDTTEIKIGNLYKELDGLDYIPWTESSNTYMNFTLRFTSTSATTLSLFNVTYIDDGYAYTTGNISYKVYFADAVKFEYRTFDSGKYVFKINTLAAIEINNNVFDKVYVDSPIGIINYAYVFEDLRIDKHYKYNVKIESKHSVVNKNRIGFSIGIVNKDYISGRSIKLYNNETRIDSNAYTVEYAFNPETTVIFINYTNVYLITETTVTFTTPDGDYEFTFNI